MKRTAVYPQPLHDTQGTRVVGQAGGMLLTRTAVVSGLAGGLSRALSRWRKPFAIHDAGKIVADLAITLALGGDCLADAALLRGEPAVYGHVASDPTISRLIGTLAGDAPAVLKAIDTARAQASLDLSRFVVGVVVAGCDRRAGLIVSCGCDSSPGGVPVGGDSRVPVGVSACRGRF